MAKMTAGTIRVRRNSGSKTPLLRRAMNFARASAVQPERGEPISATTRRGKLVRPTCAGFSEYGGAEKMLTERTEMVSSQV